MKLWSLKNNRILIVDDFPAMRSMMRHMLASYGADNIKEARNGEEALVHLEEETKEIILCDYNLGEGRDGQQILEEAKQRELLPYSSIFIMATAENTSEMVMGAVEFQPDDYLVKPFNKIVLQARLRKLQDKKAAFEEISDAIEGKDYRYAINLCDTLANTDQKNVFELLKLKGDLLMRLADYDGAEALYEKILDTREVPWAQFGLGKVFFYRKEFEDSQTVFEDLIATQKNFIVAYDWLAATLKHLGNNRKSQEILAKAVVISPKAILRQRALGEVAYLNEDFVLSAKSYKRVVHDAKNSIHKDPNDYGGLAKAYVKQESATAAVKVLCDMAKEFEKADATMQLKAAVIEGVVHKNLGNTDKSGLAIDKAMELFSSEPGALSSDIAMEVAQTCLALGKTDQANELIKHVVRNHHEDQAVLDRVQSLYAEAGMADEGNTIIAGTRQEVVELNNDGVDLAKQGKLKESIRLFQRAARAMPENIVVNLNAAQSLIMIMQSRGTNDRHLEQIRGYLDRAGDTDATNKRYQKLLHRYHELFNGSAKH